MGMLHRTPTGSHLERTRHSEGELSANVVFKMRFPGIQDDWHADCQSSPPGTKEFELGLSFVMQLLAFNL